MTHLQVPVKCINCGVHFVICTYYEDRHLPSNIYCPECGTQGSSLVFPSRRSDLQIFEVVPGKSGAE